MVKTFIDWPFRFVIVIVQAVRASPRARLVAMRRLLRSGAVIFALATLLALFFASQGVMPYGGRGGYKAPPFSLFLTVALVEWWGWALLAPAVLWLARPRRRRWLIVAAALPAVVAVKVALNATGRAAFMDYDLELQPRDLHTTVLTYVLIVAGAYLLELARRSARLEGLLAAARLQALAAQLQPHFLFNTLNAIQSLIHDDPESADRMISHLGDLLRAS